MKIKSIISMFIAVVLLLSVIPTTVLAAHECSYVYVASENVITEDCIYCEHNETATVFALMEDIVYDGTPKEGATVQYSSNWQGGTLTIVYENNINACDGTAYAYIQKDNAKAEVYFTILAATPEHNMPNNLTADPGTVLSAIVLPTATNGTWSWMKPNDTVGDAGNKTFKAFFTPNDTDNYITLLVNVPVTVNKKKVAKPTGDNRTFIYNGQEQTYTIAESSDYTIAGNVQTNAGAYDVVVALKDSTNYEWEDGSTTALTFNFDIAKANRNAPNVSKTDETIYGKNDGKIADVSTDMVYRVAGEETYTAITGETIENLADGKYYIRFKGDNNHNASSDTEVIIGAGRMLVVTYKADGQVVATAEVEYGKDATAPTIPQKTGYTQTAPTWDKDGKNITADTEINAVYTPDPKVPYEESDDIKSPQTGDDSNIWLWAILSLTSGLLLLITLFWKKQEAKEN